MSSTYARIGVAAGLVLGGAIQAVAATVVRQQPAPPAANRATPQAQEVSPSPVPDVAGDYQADAITITVTRLQDGALTLSFPGQPLYHLELDTGLRYTFRELPGFAVEFNRDASGVVNAMIVTQPPPQHDFRATRKVASAVTTPPPSDSSVAEYAGDYQAGPTVLTVTVLQDRTITFSVPGQQLYHLELENGTRYRIRELPGFGVEFTRDAKGLVSGLTVHQAPPQKDFSATRKRQAK
ncbi:MAG TPA: hypothetical protein VGF24_15950 [Vicinamibacterales bacterium]